jgi:hypothetical protein
MQCWQPQVSDGPSPAAGNSHAQVHGQQQQHQSSARLSATHSDAQQQHSQLAQQQLTSFCTPVEAWQHGKLTLGFSGGGFLLPYHLGVFHSLAKMGIVSTATPMAGSSAGSLVSNGPAVMLLTLFEEILVIYEATKWSPLAHSMHRHSNCIYTEIEVMLCMHGTAHGGSWCPG